MCPSLAQRCRVYVLARRVWAATTWPGSVSYVAGWELGEVRVPGGRHPLQRWEDDGGGDGASGATGAGGNAGRQRPAAIVRGKSRGAGPNLSNI